jgi:phosphomevalonate kinase
MVKGVQAWRNKEPAVAKTLWDSLQKENEALGKLLLTCTPSNASALTASLNSIREHIREMGTKSGVPIEPPEQTELLDAVTNGVEGVYGGVVPGAGGYDAVVFLIKDSPETETALKAFLSTWSVEKKSNVKLLNVKGEMEGAKEETEMDYGHWIT